jgi:hypothetical protein
MVRKHIPSEIETSVLVKSARRCTLCFQLSNDLSVKMGQIAHLDKDSSNIAEDNLAFMCLDHHSLYDSTTSQHRNYSIREVKISRDKLHQVMSNHHLSGQSPHLGQGWPDLSGRWEGWSRNSLAKEWLPTAHEIVQGEFGLSAIAWGPENWCRSICAAIVVDPLGGVPELIWTYRSEGITSFPPPTAHTGTHMLHRVFVRGKAGLEGKYFRDKPHIKGIGRVGFIRVMFAGRELRNTLDYRKREWRMRQPPNLPPAAGTNDKALSAPTARLVGKSK